MTIPEPYRPEADARDARIASLESKLARAVGALEEIAVGCRHSHVTEDGDLWCPDLGPRSDYCTACIARAALEEIRK